MRNGATLRRQYPRSSSTLQSNLTEGSLFASGHRIPAPDTFKLPPFHSGIFLSFAIKGLHFALNWYESCRK
jgi:hypothetical protein